MSSEPRFRLPIAAGFAGTGFLTLVYVGIVSLAESPRHAVDLLWQDRWIVLPIILGFGIQSALYITLKKGLFLPVEITSTPGALTGASGATSTMAMVACCAHHITDVLPILGMTAATTFLAEYKTPFMLVGLSMTWLGIAVMLLILFKNRRKALEMMEAV